MTTIWPFPPDWSNPVIERLEWSTDVLRAQSDNEQRLRLRMHPRRQLEYLVTAMGDAERVRLEHALLAGQGQSCLAPMWLDGMPLMADAAAASAFACETAAREIAPGDLVVVAADGRAEAGEVATVQPDSLELATPLAGTWSAGSWVAPARAARLQNGLAVAYACDAVGQATVRFQFDDEWPIAPAAETADYRGYPVLTSQTNWAENLSADYSRSLDEFDPGLGLRAVSDLSGFASVTRSHSWTLGSRAEIAAFRAWCAARAGRLVPFWLPSLQADLKLVSAAGAAATSLQVENRGYAAWLAAVPTAAGRRDIMIQSAAGIRYRRITGATTISTTVEQITLDSPLGISISPETTELMSFMRLVRLAADSVEIAHYTDEVAVSTLSLVGIRDGA